MQKVFTVCHSGYSRSSRAVFILLLLILSYGHVFAQCPSASCIPGNATDPATPDFHTGISSVTIGSFSDSRAVGLNQGFLDNSCINRNITLMAGVRTPVSIANGDIADENVRIWTDLNNNNVFDGSEQIFSSNAAKVHTGAISIPASAVTGIPLRLRIGSDLSTAAVPTACGTPQFGQFIDYAIVVSPNTLAPVADFTSADSVTCSGIVRFTDLSLNFPNRYLWDFGDGLTSAEASPVHNYASPGTYNVSLTVFNANGQNERQKIGFVVYNGSAPVAPLCTPITTNPCCGYNLSNVSFGTIHSGNTPTTTGYTDFSCRFQARFTRGSRVLVSGTAGTVSAQDVKMYVDFNNNGNMADDGAPVLAVTNVSGSFSGYAQMGSVNGVFNVPLRARIVTDFAGAPLNACDNISGGRTQDFAVILEQNTIAPVASFTADSATTCSGLHTFTYTGSGTADRFIWTYGDGYSDTTNQYLVRHTYVAAGTYTVSLTVINNIGSVTVSKPDYITFIPAPLAVSCVPTSGNSFTGITSFTLGSYTNYSTVSTSAYQNFTCNGYINVAPGLPLDVSVFTSGVQYQAGALYVDLDTNGIFSTATEKLWTYSLTSPGPHSGVFSMPYNFPIDKPVRLRVISNIQNGPQNVPNVSPCASTFSEGEDYTLFCRHPVVKPVAKIRAQPNVTCVNTPVSFADVSLNVPNIRSWDFGDGTVLTNASPAPAHTFTAPGVYPVKLVSSNDYGTDSVISYITVTGQALRPATCTYTQATNIDAASGILNLTLAGINNSSLSAADEGSLTFPCAGTELTEGNYYPISITTGYSFGEFLAVYLDLNNDGAYSTSERLLNTERLVGTINAIIYIPGGAVKDTPLRLRLVTDHSANPLACGTARFGQAEDYPIIIRRNPYSPVAKFTCSANTSCSPAFTFADSSYNLPLTWEWDFGDQTGTVQTRNPVHTYASPGIYTVRLIVTNDSGTDTLTRVQYINYAPASGLRATTCNNQPGSNFVEEGLSIRTFSLADLSYAANGPSKNYTDRSCYLKAHTVINNMYSFTLNTYRNAKYGIFVDWNADGTFTPAEAIKKGGPGTAFTGTFRIPANAVTTEPLRLRVTIDDDAIDTIASCRPLRGGHSEDFSLIVGQPDVPPVVGFRSSTRNTCYGTVSFTDTSTNLPLTFLWRFGDGETSTERNPTHTYAQPGTYSVTLLATNTAGTDSLVRTNYITVTANMGLSAPACVNSITRPTAVFGMQYFNFNSNVTNVRLGSYLDISCQPIGQVTWGNYYPITIRSISSQFLVSGYIDYNNNGAFSEEEYLTIRQQTPNNVDFTASVFIPDSLPLNKAIRIRLICENDPGVPQGPCHIINAGNVVDFSVLVVANTAKPVALFSSPDTVSCSGTVAFRNLTRNLPSTYRWDFGDGSPLSNDVNPVHQYERAGRFNVKLYALNPFGNDSLTLTNYINITGLGGPVPPVCRPATTDYSIAYSAGIRRVRLGTIDNSTANAAEGYKDFTCQYSTGLAAGDTATITVTLGSISHENVWVWIDYNNNGSFEANELIAYWPNIIGNNSKSFIVPADVAFSQNVRMRVMDDFVEIPARTSECQAMKKGQVEDYTITIAEGTGKNKAKILAEVYPNPSSGMFTVKVEPGNSRASQIEVFSQTGQLIFSAPVKNNETPLDLSSRPKGLYLVKISTAQGVLTQRIVIQ
ncbi:MAG: PKD domain-containing protein [Bacteroidota bacterium]